MRQRSDFYLKSNIYWIWLGRKAPRANTLISFLPSGKNEENYHFCVRACACVFVFVFAFVCFIYLFIFIILQITDTDKVMSKNKNVSSNNLTGTNVITS